MQPKDLTYLKRYILLGMWTIFEHKKLNKQLSKAPIEIQKRYEKWKDIVELSGPSGLRLIRGFNDEALSGNWKGFRSSRLNQQYRVNLGIERAKSLARALRCHPAVLVFPGWDVESENAA